jgi:predicted dehydrogenase
MPRTSAISRRRFLTRASAAALCPAIVPRAALGLGGRAPASDRITVGFIGCGKMMNDYHIPEVLKQSDTQAVAVCEVDAKRRAHARQRIEKHYSADGSYRGCSEHADFRELLARPDIDAVIIATPDHWHALPILAAARAGKDIYCEKPLTLTILEAQRAIEAVRRHGRVFQTGSQQRSNVFGPFREAVEIIRSGRLGKVLKVEVGVGGPSRPCELPEETPEPGLEWDLWLGAAPLRPYHSSLSPRGVHNHFPAWRNYREYSGGGHTDMGAHHYDIAHWALGLDGTGPLRIVPPEDPQAQRGVRYFYEGGLEIVHGGPGGCLFTGTNGTLRIDRGHLSSQPEAIVKEPLGEKDVKLFRSPGHHRNWLDCIRSRTAPVASVEAGARTVTVIHLGNLAYQLRRELRWDPVRWEFPGDDEANRRRDRERRDPWQLPPVEVRRARV